MAKQNKKNQVMSKYPVVIVTWFDAVGYGRKYDSNEDNNTTSEIDKIDIDGFLRETVSVGILRKRTPKAVMILQEYEKLNSIENTDFTVIPESWINKIKIIGWIKK